MSTRPPRRKNSPIITRSLLINVLVSSACILLVTLGVYMMNIENGVVSSRDRTLTFTAFVFADMWNSFACRSSKYSSFKLGENTFYRYAVSFCIVGQLVVIYLPPFQSIFQTVPLSLFDLLGVAFLSSIVLIVDETRKRWKGVSVGRLKKFRYRDLSHQVTNV